MDKRRETLPAERQTNTLPALQLSKTEFLQAYSPAKCLKAMAQYKTPLQCSTAKEIPTVAAIRKTYGEEYISGYIKLWIVNLYEFFGKSALSDAQLDEAAFLALDGRYYLNLADINAVFTSLKKASTDISPQKIVRAFEDYDGRRAAEYYNHSVAAETFPDYGTRTAELKLLKVSNYKPRKNK
ncbi:MAG: hypothetical protein IKS00_01260 [Bacteroidales bacterium]|nr:hypothetical protein [Bacteroidales bacterium]